MAEASKKRKDLSLQEKQRILELSRMSQHSAAVRLKISQPLLCKILTDRTLKRQHLPISTYRSTLTDQHLPTSTYRSALTDQHSPISIYRSALTDQHLPISTYRSTFNDQHSPISTYRSEHGSEESMIGEGQSS
jgi:hypothetical protein